MPSFFKWLTVIKSHDINAKKPGSRQSFAFQEIFRLHSQVETIAVHLLCFSHKAQPSISFPHYNNYNGILL